MKAIHRYPVIPDRWISLSQFIMKYLPHEGNSHLTAIQIGLEMVSKASTTQSFTTESKPQLYCHAIKTLAKSYLSVGKNLPTLTTDAAISNAIQHAKKAIHVYPTLDHLDSWLVLAMGMRARVLRKMAWYSRSSDKTKSFDAIWQECKRLESVCERVHGLACNRVQEGADKKGVVELALWSKVFYADCLVDSVSFQKEYADASREHELVKPRLELSASLANQVIADGENITDDALEQMGKHALLSRALLVLARCLNANEEVSQTLLAYKKALSIDPGMIIGWEELGAIYNTKMNLPQAAELCYRQALVLGSTSHDRSHSLRLLLRLAKLGHDTGNEQLGFEAVGEAVKTDLASSVPRLLQSLLFIRQGPGGNLNRALKSLQSMVAAFTPTPAAEGEENAQALGDSIPDSEKLFIQWALSQALTVKGEKGDSQKMLDNEQKLQESVAQTILVGR